MSRPGPSGPERVQRLLDRLDPGRRVQSLPETTATSVDAAAALGVPLSKIGKSVVVVCGAEVFVVVLPGDRRVDLRSIPPSVPPSEARPLSRDRVEETTGFPVGGVSPFALPENVCLLIDRTLQGEGDFFVAAGHPHAVVRADFAVLASLPGAAVGAFSSS